MNQSSGKFNFSKMNMKLNATSNIKDKFQE